MQKHWRQKGQTLVGRFGLHEHQTAESASNSPRQFQHWIEVLAQILDSLF